MKKLTKEERAAKRAQEFTEDRAKLEAQLQRTIELVTAMFWELECGENRSKEQVAAAWDDQVLGVLWWRIWDYAAYCSKRGQINAVGCREDVSLFLDYVREQSKADLDAMMSGNRPSVSHSEKVRQIAVQGHPKARVMRRRHEKERAA